MEGSGRQSWGEDKAPLVMDVPGLCVRNLRRTNRTQDYLRVIRILSLDLSNLLSAFKRIRIAWRIFFGADASTSHQNTCVYLDLLIMQKCDFRYCKHEADCVEDIYIQRWKSQRIKIHCQTQDFLQIFKSIPMVPYGFLLGNHKHLAKVLLLLVC